MPRPAMIETMIVPLVKKECSSASVLRDVPATSFVTLLIVFTFTLGVHDQPEQAIQRERRTNDLKMPCWMGSVMSGGTMSPPASEVQYI